MAAEGRAAVFKGTGQRTASLDDMDRNHFLDMLQGLARMHQDATHSQRNILSLQILNNLERCEVQSLVELLQRTATLMSERSLTRVLSSQSSISPNAAVPENLDLASKSVLVFGSIAMDLIAEVPTFPQVNSTMSAEKFMPKAGGKGANEAVAVARLRVRTFMVGLVGDDDFGRIMRNQLQLEHVNIEYVRKAQHNSTGVAMIMVSKDNTGKSTIPCLAANNLVGQGEVDCIERVFQDNENVDFLVMQLEVAIPAVVAAARMARRLHKTIILKASPLRSAHDVPSELLELIDVLLVNEAEAPALLGWEAKSLVTLAQCHQAAEELQQTLNIPTVIVCTAFGNVLHTRLGATPFLSDTMTIPHMRVKVVDFIGAADAFTGGFVAALTRGLSMRYAMLWAGCCAALSCMAHGAQESMPHLEKIYAFMTQNGLGVAPAIAGEVAPWPTSMPELWLSNQHLVKYIFQQKYEELTGALTCLEEPARMHLLENCVDFQGQTLLHIAILASDLSAVCILLRFGASPFAKDRYARSCIDRAWEYLQLDLCRRHTFLNEAFSRIMIVLTVARCLAQVSMATVPAGLHAPEEYRHRLDGLPNPVTVQNLPVLLHSLLMSSSKHCQEYVAYALLELGRRPLQADDPVSRHLSDFRRAIVKFHNVDEVNFVHAAAFAGNCDLLRMLVEWGASKTSRCGKGMTALHFSAIGHAEPTCHLLLEWGLKLQMLDTSKKSPLEYCHNDEFRRKLASLGNVFDLFISYGHQEDVTKFVKQLNSDLDLLGFTSWIDGTEIQGGDHWKEAIVEGISHCRAVVVVLSQKWLKSQWCHGELLSGIYREKPIFAIMPPVPATESVRISDFPSDVRSYITERQYFDFSDPRRYSQVLDDLRAKLLLCNKSRLVAFETPMSTALFPGQETPVIELPEGVLSSSQRKFLLIVCAEASASDPKKRTHFADVLARNFRLKGVAVIVARKSHSVELLRVLLNDDDCAAVLLVLSQNDDQTFLSRMLDCSNAANKHIFAVPYHASVSFLEKSIGFTYFSASKRANTVCFIDWYKDGSFEKCVIFQDVFEQLSEKVHKTTNGVLLQMQPAAPVFSVTDEANLPTHPVV